MWPHVVVDPTVMCCSNSILEVTWLSCQELHVTCNAVGSVPIKIVGLRRVDAATPALQHELDMLTATTVDYVSPLTITLQWSTWNASTPASGKNGESPVQLGRCVYAPNPPLLALIRPYV